MTTHFEGVIGLEVHAHLLSRSKLFCGCSTAFGAAPNTHVCPVCLGLPGALPVPNGGAVDMAVRAGLALGCTIRERSRFARKNYFYPDLAKGYQISQYELPLCEGGAVSIDIGGVPRAIRLTRIHMEEDAAKNRHGGASGQETLVDFNRAGVPLVEIVSEPELQSAEEAEQYLRRLREVLMAIGVNDGNLEEGSFRCDANVSIRPLGDETLGTRVELKNINSFRFVRKAIEHELARQEAIVSGGGAIEQETRTWSDEQGKTFSMREKEEAHDYRYFPDPDLPPLHVPASRVEAIRTAMPRLPDATRAVLIAEYGCTPYDAQVLTAHPAVSTYVIAAATRLSKVGDGTPLAAAGKQVANFVQAELLGDVVLNGLEAKFPVPSDAVAELLGIVQSGRISGKMAKDVLVEMRASGQGARAIVEAKGLTQVSDSGTIESEVKRVLEANPGQVAHYRAGKTALLGFFVGQVMRATKGKANPALVNDIVRRLLS